MSPSSGAGGAGEASATGGAAEDGPARREVLARGAAGPRPSLETVARWRARGQRRVVLGRSLFRVAAGEQGGTPVVLVHGFPTSSHDWSAMLPLVAARRRVFAVDLLGYGLSEKPHPHEYTIGEQADLLEAWLVQEGGSRAHVVAHDMGDTVVQEILARRLEGRGGVELASLLLLNGGIVVEKIRPILAQRLLRSRVLGPLAARFLGEKAFARSLRGISSPGRQPTDEELAASWEIVLENEGPRVYPELIRYMDERVTRRDRWRHGTLGHRFPMRLVWGDADPISPYAMAEEVKAERPATDVVRLEGTGHYPQLEEPARVAELVLEWAERNEGR